LSDYFNSSCDTKIDESLIKQKKKIEDKKFLESLLKKDNIADRIIEWKKGFRSGTTDPFFAEYIIMSEMKWTIQDIDETPEFDLLLLQKLLQTKNSVEKIENMKNSHSQI